MLIVKRSDFQTTITVLISFVLTRWIINEFVKVLITLENHSLTVVVVVMASRYVVLLQIVDTVTKLMTMINIKNKSNEIKYP